MLRCVWHWIGVSLVILMLTATTFAQPPAVQWERIYTPQCLDMGWVGFICPLPDSSVIMGGWCWLPGSPYDTARAYLWKVGPQGDTLWFRWYADDDSSLWSSFNTGLLTSDGALLVGGFTGGETFNGRWLLKVDVASGDTLWKRLSCDNSWRWPAGITSLLEAPNGDLMVYGSGIDPHTPEDIEGVPVLERYTADGTRLGNDATRPWAACAIPETIGLCATSKKTATFSRRLKARRRLATT